MSAAGIRAELAIRSPAGCPVADVAGTTGEAPRGITRGVGPPDGVEVTEEFQLPSGTAVDDAPVERVFSYEHSDVYRFTRERGAGCPCETVERHDCPIVDVQSDDGSLTLVFHAPDMDRLRAVIDDVQARFDDVEIRRLLRSASDRDEAELVVVDSGALTDRQREVLTTAHRLGYFEHPKGANAGEVAEALGISSSTFTEHLSVAQSKLFDAILAD